MVIEDQNSLWRAGYAANQRYTKDLEDMLGRIVIKSIEARRCCVPRRRGEDGHSVICLIAEAKTLLESTGYTNDF